jgi:hypothetical protein
MRRADRALDTAEQSGRDRVETVPGVGGGGAVAAE